MSLSKKQPLSTQTVSFLEGRAATPALPTPTGGATCTSWLGEPAPAAVHRKTLARRQSQVGDYTGEKGVATVLAKQESRSNASLSILEATDSPRSDQSLCVAT